MDTRLLSRLGTLRQLEIFLKVAEHKSIARAAQELHLSHSAVSIQVKKLADTLGLPLHEVLGKKLFHDTFQRVTQLVRLDSQKVRTCMFN